MQPHKELDRICTFGDEESRYNIYGAGLQSDQDLPYQIKFHAIPVAAGFVALDLLVLNAIDESGAQSADSVLESSAGAMRPLAWHKNQLNQQAVWDCMTAVIGLAET